ncbi:MAG TPA: hypothetical protein VGL58_17775 [Caulobacteraceae bacterium]
MLDDAPLEVAPVEVEPDQPCFFFVLELVLFVADPSVLGPLDGADALAFAPD